MWNNEGNHKHNGVLSGYKQRTKSRQCTEDA